MPYLHTYLGLVLLCAIFIARTSQANDDSISSETRTLLQRSLKTTRPNVILFISDDLRADIAPYRQDMTHLTPNLVAFARNSLTFGKAYVAMSTCGPSRNSFLTGRRNDNLHSWNFLDSIRKRSSGVVTLPQLLKQQGYDTLSFGKVFHHYPDIRDDNKLSWTSITLPSYQNEQTCDAFMNEAWCECDDKDLICIDRAIATAAIKALRQKRRLKRSFFMGIGFRRPHLDFISPVGYAEFNNTPFNNIPAVKSPPNFNQPGGMPNIAFSFCSDADSKEPFTSIPNRLKPWSTYGDWLYSSYRREYFRTVAFMDEQFGRVLSALDAIPGLRDNTLVIFTSDNGKGVGERNHFCKNALFDVDNRVPLIMRPPPSILNRLSIRTATWKGGVVNAEVELLDLFRTVTSLVGANPPTCLVEGRDLTPYFRNPSSQPFVPVEGLLTVNPLNLSALNVSRYSFALSQIGRCNVNFGSSDECSSYTSDVFQMMGYSIKTTSWRYTEWRLWNGALNDVDWTPAGLNASELYRHNVLGVNLPNLNFDKFENENVVDKYKASIVPRFSAILKWLVRTSRAMYPPECQPII